MPKNGTYSSLQPIASATFPVAKQHQEQVPPGAAEQGPKDSMMGAGFVEIRLTRLLSD